MASPHTAKRREVPRAARWTGYYPLGGRNSFVKFLQRHFFFCCFFSARPCSGIREPAHGPAEGDSERGRSLRDFSFSPRRQLETIKGQQKLLRGSSSSPRLRLFIRQSRSAKEEPQTTEPNMPQKGNY
ncbi:hypothetical protein SRHO_G00116270 [Serrasalmus rhombeus]